MLSYEEFKGYKECSGNLWSLFKDFATEDYTNKEKAMDRIFADFRNHIREYAGRRFYSYAVQYGQTLVYELERIIYGDRVVKHDHFIVQRMPSDEFNIYRNNPNVGDVITETKPDGTQIRWHVDAIIKP